MNDKETELYRIVDSVVSCCATQIDAEGHVNLTVEDVLGKSRAENVLMACFCVLCPCFACFAHALSAFGQCFACFAPAFFSFSRFSGNL